MMEVNLKIMMLLVYLDIMVNVVLQKILIFK